MAKKKKPLADQMVQAGGDEKDSKPAEESEKKDGGGGAAAAPAAKEGGTVTAVLKVDMHCQGCIKKIRQSIHGFHGVEGVAADVGTGKITVIGKMDPVKLRDRVASKTHKTVVLVSPAVPAKKDNPTAAAACGDGKKPGGGGGGGGEKDQKKPNEKKTKEPAVTTVVLKVRLDCQGCIERIRRTVLQVKGAEQVAFEAEKDLVTVKGTMDGKKMAEAMTKKLKRTVEVVAPKKDEKKEKGGADGEKKEKGGGGAAAAAPAAAGGKKEQNGGKAADANKMDYYGHGYTVEMVHAPQLFSDENPNACSVM